MTRANSLTEIPLSGGRTNLGIVRIGNTVYRPMRPNSEFIQALLKHIRSQGCDCVPEPLGFDSKGREVLSFIEGDVPSELGFHNDETLIAAANMIRAYHDVTRGFISNSNLEVICHNDLSPCNFVFREGKPIGIIDFDAATPGSRVMDLGYAAWLWLNLGNDELAMTEQERRFELFLKAYREDNSKAVIEAMLLRQKMLMFEGQRLGKVAMAAWAEYSYDWTIKHFWESHV